MTATLPLSPFLRVGSRGGRTPVSMPNNSVLFDIISLYSRIRQSYAYPGSLEDSNKWFRPLFHLLH